MNIGGFPSTLKVPARQASYLIDISNLHSMHLPKLADCWLTCKAHHLQVFPGVAYTSLKARILICLTPFRSCLLLPCFFLVSLCENMCSFRWVCQSICMHMCVCGAHVHAMHVHTLTHSCACSRMGVHVRQKTTLAVLFLL